MTRILIVEDEPNARAALGEVFRARYDVDLAADAAEGEAHLSAHPPDLVLTDIVLPGERDGLDLLRHVRQTQPDVPVIVMTAYGSVDKAVSAMRGGAHDFLEKPLDLARLRNLVASALRDAQHAEKSAPYRSDLDREGVPPGFIGSAPKVVELFRIVAKAAPTKATVLVVGESGTGKELVAEAIHRASPRSQAPFVKVNCAALAEGLLESELFGHAKGSFTGATSDRSGRFEAADGGTLFLDEVGEIPIHTQVKLLRVLQNREVERVGETKSRAVDVRLVGATNADLDALVRKGAFREDFYFRLKVITLRMPPLRERAGDIPALVDHFRVLYAKRHGRVVPDVSDEAMVLLRGYRWPGNVRELENTIEAAVVLSGGEGITAGVLPEELGGEQRLEDLPDAEVIPIPVGTPLPEAERRIILDTLNRTGGNKTAAARILGIGLRTLYRKLESYGAGADSV